MSCPASGLCKDLGPRITGYHELLKICWCRLCESFGVDEKEFWVLEAANAEQPIQEI